MDNPRAVAHPGQSPQDLRIAYAGQQRGRSARRHARSGVQSIKGAILGVMLGAATVFVFCVLDKQPFFWQSAAWDAALCGFAGIILGRTMGGPSAGAVLFGAAYAGAHFLRLSKYNSIRILEPGLPALQVSLHSGFAMLGALVLGGAFLGYLNALKQ